jgi:hypothetical protein
VIKTGKTTMRILGLLALLFSLAVAAATAQADMVELESCSDASGRMVQVVQDPSLKVLVQSGLDGGHRVIRYNSDLLPNLSATAKQFFFAHECARQSPGDVPGAPLTPRRAQTLDCVAIATLQASGLLKEPAAVEALQAELILSEDEWDLVPGPRRAFNLTSCPKQASLVLPPSTTPTPNQVEWDACVRQCGDQLFRCRGCRGAGCGDACQSTYDRCQAACKMH